MLSRASLIGRRAGVAATARSVRMVSTGTLTPVEAEACRILDLTGCTPGDVILQNGSTEVAKEVASQGYERGCFVVTVMPPHVDFKAKSVDFKQNGGFAMVVDTYTRSFRLRRLLQDLRSPSGELLLLFFVYFLWPFANAFVHWCGDCQSLV
jgi:hypothetical protein